MAADTPERPPAIDVEALMSDLRERIADKKAAGLYGVDDLAADLRVTGDLWDAEQLERAQLASRVMPGLITSPSEGQLLGKAMERVKEQIVRASWRNLADLADQLNRFHAEITAYSTSLGAEVRRMSDEIREIRAGQDGGGLASLEGRIDRLAAMIPEGAASAAPDIAELPTVEDPPSLAPLLAREMATAGDGLLLRCGTGRLLDALGAGYRGVDDRAQFAEPAKTSGRPILAADPLSYLNGLPQASVDRIVMREIAESRPVDEMGRLVDAARRALADDGALAVVVRNYGASAEREQFWRDPWRLRPVEPETIVALAAAAGLREIQTYWAGDEESLDPVSARPTARCAVVIARNG